MQATYVYFKDGSDAVVQAALTLNVGESILSIAQGPVSPTDASTLVPTIISGLSSNIQMSLQGGTPNVSYGFPVTITTNQRVWIITVAVSVGDSVFEPYNSTDPTSFNDMLGSVDAGDAVLATTVFPFPVDLDPSGGFVLWELMDDQGVVYAAGNAFDYVVTSNGLSNTVMARAIINVPSNTPPSVDRPYTLRYTLNLPMGEDQQKFYSYESVMVAGLALVPLGTSNSLEMKGDIATVYIVTDKLYDSVEVELQYDGNSLGSAQVTQATRVAGGYYYAADFDTSNLPVSIEPYIVLWKYKQSLQSSAFRESASLWIVNSSVLSAIDDVKAKINKARQTLYGVPNSQYAPDTIMTWLRRARDAFNSSYGVFTSFTMTNAKGGLREYWLLYAELMALDAQYLFEGESAFQFQGASISLDVDRTSFLDSAASKIQSKLDNEFKSAKQIMVTRGAMSGDGSVDPAKLQRGAIGSVGITLSPASSVNAALPFLRRF